MKRQLRRFIAMFLAVCMAVGLIHINARADELANVIFTIDGISGSTYVEVTYGETDAYYDISDLNDLEEIVVSVPLDTEVTFTISDNPETVDSISVLPGSLEETEWTYGVVETSLTTTFTEVGDYYVNAVINKSLQIK